MAIGEPTTKALTTRTQRNTEETKKRTSSHTKLHHRSRRGMLRQGQATAEGGCATRASRGIGAVTPLDIGMTRGGRAVESLAVE